MEKNARFFKLSRFLKRAPQPARVVGEHVDGDEVSVSLAGAGGPNWADAISALGGCYRVRAVDKDGSILRVLELERDELESEPDARSRAGSIISIDVPKLVESIAKNMRDVAAGAAQQQAAAQREGFAAMTAVVNLSLNLLVRLEQRLEAAEDRARGPETNPEDAQRSQLAMLAMQRLMGGAPPAAAPTAPTNGGGGFQLTPELIQSVISQFVGAPDNSEDPNAS